MKKRILCLNFFVGCILIIDVASTFLGWAHCDAKSLPNKPIVWGKTFGGKHIDNANCIQQTSDGGYIVAGDTFSFGSGKGDIYIIKLDNKGNKIWERMFGGKESDVASSIQQTSDGGYVVAGGTSSFGSGNGDVYVIKMDGQGHKAWEKTFGGKEWDNGNSVQQTADGGYIVAGATGSFGSGKGEAYIIKLDDKGNKVWEKTFKGNGTAKAQSIQQTSDGGYIAVGSTFSFDSKKGQIYIIKLDGKGDKVWEKMYGEKDRNTASTIQKTSDNGYIIAGQISPFEPGKGEAYILKLDNKGDKVWEKIYGIKDLDPASFVTSKDSKGASANALENTSDGGYVVAIATYSRVTITESYILKLDKDGQKIWVKKVGVHDLDKEDSALFRTSAQVYASSIQQSSDDGYVLAGGITDRKEGISDIYIVKTDPNGVIR